MIICTVCKEPIALVDNRWTHGHGYTYCGTGDAATAYPPAEELHTWLESL